MKVRDHALALRETARDSLMVATNKCREKEAEIGKLRSQVCAAFVRYVKVDSATFWLLFWHLA